MGELHFVGEAALHRAHEHLVARSELVEPVERRPVGRAVPGDGGVALLPGHRGLRIVARPLAEVGLADALDHDLVDADLGDSDVGHGVAGRRRRWRLERVERRRRGRRAGLDVGLLLELRPKAVLLAGGVEPRPPQLVGHEEEDQDSGTGQDGAEGAEHGAEAVHHSRLPAFRFTVRTLGRFICLPGGKSG